MTRLLILLSLLPASLRAQQPKMIPLKPANAALTDPLAVGQVRELRDGRLIVAGRGSMVVADMAKGTLQVIPNVPLGTLVPLGGDSTLVAAGTIGWIFLDGDKALGMLPSSNPVVKATESPVPFSADQAGFVLSSTGEWPDSANAILIRRATNQQERIARLWRGEPWHTGSAPVFIVSEIAVLSLDGWVAVVRAHPYRIDWRTPNGAWIHGAPLPIPPMPMDQRERAAYADYMGPAVDQTRMKWPDWVEPFTYPAPIATPDGKVLVRRWPSADLPGLRYDVINRRGELEGQIALPSRRDAIAGFGEKSIYLVTVPDSTNPQRSQLERRPWP